MKKIHRLKTWPTPFQDVKWGRKPFEIRKNDRNYSEGDFLVLDEWSPDREEYTDEKPIVRMVTYLMHGGRFGIEDGFVALGIDRLGDERVANVLIEVAPARPATEKESGEPK